MFSFLLGIYLGVEFLGPKETVFNILRNYFAPLYIPSSQVIKRFCPHVAYEKTRHREASNLHRGPGTGWQEPPCVLGRGLAPVPRRLSSQALGLGPGWPRAPASLANSRVMVEREVVTVDPCVFMGCRAPCRMSAPFASFPAPSGLGRRGHPCLGRRGACLSTHGASGS